MDSRQFNFGTVEVGEDGTIKLPEEALEKLNIKEGDTLAIVGDEKFGLAITKVDMLQNTATELINGFINGNAAEVINNLTGLDLSDLFGSNDNDDE